MTWNEVATKEFRDAIRSRWLWVVTALFLLVFGLPALGLLLLDLGVVGDGSLSGTTNTYIQLLRGVTGTLVPLVAILIAYASVTTERESGSLKVLLSFPHARRDVTAGKTVGRTAVVGVPMVVALLLAMGLLLGTGLTVKPAALAAFGAATLLLAGAYTAITVAVSAAVSSGRRAIVVMMGIYVTTVMFWDFVSGRLVQELFRRTELQGETALLLKTQLGLKLLNPAQAYNALVSGAAGNTPAAYSLFRGLLGGVFGNPKRRQAIELLGDPAPLYFQPPAITLSLLLWILIPLVVGTLLFEASDL